MKNGMYQIIAVADMHYGAGNDDHLNMEVQEVLISYIKENASTLDVFIILGDLSHRQLSLNEKSSKYQSSFILTINSLSLEYGFKFIILKGTLRHDYNQLEMYRKLEVMNHNFHIVNTVDIMTLDEQLPITALMIPEEYVENVDEYYKEYIDIDPDEGRYDFIFAHGTFDFAGYVSKLSTSEKQMKNAPTFKSAKFKDLAYGCTLSGHVHTPMDKNNVFYCGSFSRFAYGEEEEKGFYEILYDVKSLNVELNFIENTLAPTYITIDVSKLPKNMEKRMKYINDFKNKYDYVRIKTTENSDNEAELKLLQEMSNNDETFKVDIIHKEEEIVDHTYDFLLDDKMDMTQQIQKFAEVKFNEKISIKQVKEVINKASAEENLE